MCIRDRRNALIPIITVLAPLIVDLMTGSLVVEKIFAIPGVGSLLVTAIQSNDYNVVISLSFIYSAMYICLLYTSDLGCAAPVLARTTLRADPACLLVPRGHAFWDNESIPLRCV